MVPKHDYCILFYIPFGENFQQRNIELTGFVSNSVENYKSSKKLFVTITSKQDQPMITSDERM